MVSPKQLFLLLACLCAPAFAGSVHDDEGAHLSLPAPARRIVSLAPHATEMLFALGAGERIVGADEYSDYPPAAKSILRIGRAGSFDVERIVALRPDLVIAWGSGNPAGQLAALRRFGLTVFVSEPRKLADVAATLRRLGVLTGRVAEGGAAAREFDARLAGLRLAHLPASPVRVFYQIWDQPMLTVNGRHLISAAIEVCGGRNVFADLPPLAPTVDVEAVLRADPELIVASGADAGRPAWLEHWRRWPRLAAVRGDALVDIPPELLQRFSPRLIEGISRLCAAIDSTRQRPAAR